MAWTSVSVRLTASRQRKDIAQHIANAIERGLNDLRILRQVAYQQHDQKSEERSCTQDSQTTEQIRDKHDDVAPIDYEDTALL